MHEKTANRLYLVLMGLQEKIEQYEMEFVEPTYILSDLAENRDGELRDGTGRFK